MACSARPTTASRARATSMSAMRSARSTATSPASTATSPTSAARVIAGRLEETPGLGLPVGSGGGLALGEGSVCGPTRPTPRSVRVPRSAPTAAPRSAAAPASPRSRPIRSPSAPTAACPLRRGPRWAGRFRHGHRWSRHRPGLGRQPGEHGLGRQRRRRTPRHQCRRRHGCHRRRQRRTGPRLASLSANAYTDTTDADADPRQRYTDAACRRSATSSPSWHRVRQLAQHDHRIDQQGAMSAAMLNMATSASGLNTQNRLGVGVGVQNGAAALSIGYQRALSDKATFTFGGAAAAMTPPLASVSALAGKTPVGGALSQASPPGRRAGSAFAWDGTAFLFFGSRIPNFRVAVMQAWHRRSHDVATTAPRKVSGLRCRKCVTKTTRKSDEVPRRVPRFGVMRAGCSTAFPDPPAGCRNCRCRIVKEGGPDSGRGARVKVGLSRPGRAAARPRPGSGNRGRGPRATPAPAPCRLRSGASRRRCGYGSAAAAAAAAAACSRSW